MMNDLWIRLRSLARRKTAEAELDDELRFHLEKQSEKYARAGMEPGEARRQARLDLGGMEQVKEECRDARGVQWFETLCQDIRYGLRMLRRSPGFAAAAVVTLALGIGANTAIFSVADSALLNPLPYAGSSRLYLVFASRRGASIAKEMLTYPDFVEVRDHNHVFSAVAGLASHDLTLTGRSEPSIVSAVSVTTQFFSVLGAKPLLGRMFLPGDGRRGAAPVAILSEGLWRSRFGSDRKILGRSIVLDHRPFTVVGVMPAGFRTPFIPRADQVWIPVLQDPLFRSFTTLPGRHWLPTLARLGPGVTRAQAQSEMETLAARLAHRLPAQNAGWTAGIDSLQKEVVGPHVRTALFVLLGAVGLLLLVACANIASLLLARASARSREMALRSVFGASRGRLIGQLLVESALLGLLGAAGGIALAFVCVRAMRPLLPSALPKLRPIGVNGEALIFALTLSLAASFLFGLAPALWAADTRFCGGSKDAPDRATESSSRRRGRSVLAAVEIALAMVLLVGAGLLIRSFVSLTSVRPGFQTRHVWQAEVSLPRFEYSTRQQWSSFADQLIHRLHTEPGIKDAAFGAPLPFFVQGDLVLDFRIVGNPPRPGEAKRTAHYVSVSPDYFRAMGIPLLSGRFFRPADSFKAPHVAIVSRAFGRRYFPHENPIGKQLVCGFPPGTQAARLIVGVVGDVRDVSLGRAPAPMMYVPFAQAPLWGGPLVVKSSLNSAGVYAAIRQATSSIDPSLPVTEFASLQTAIGASVASPRFRMLLLALFGALALVLASTGIFGIVSYSFSRRTHELGVRAALGATPGEIQRMVLREGAKLAVSGLATGTIAALFLTRFLQGELFGIGTGDLLTYAGAAVLLGAVALTACYLPARRAASVDPIAALRHE